MWRRSITYARPRSAQRQTCAFVSKTSLYRRGRLMLIACTTFKIKIFGGGAELGLGLAFGGDLSNHMPLGLRLLREDPLHCVPILHKETRS